MKEETFVAKKTPTRTLVISGILAALIFVFTFLIRVPVNSTGAYMNIGDSVIYCAGMLVGAPWAAAASGIGSMLADILLGGGIYIPATLVIKALMGLVCALLMKNGGLPKFILACVLGGAVMTVGYGLFEWVMFGWAYAAGTLVFNLIQWAAGVAVAVALYYPVKRTKGLLS